MIEGPPGGRSSNSFPALPVERRQRLFQHRLQRQVHRVGDPVQFLDPMLGSVNIDLLVAPGHMAARPPDGL